METETENGRETDEIETDRDRNRLGKKTAKEKTDMEIKTDEIETEM